MEQEKEPCVRIGSHSSDCVDITGLIDSESEIIRAAIRGHQWITVEGGRIKACSTRKPLPGPVEDEEMLPFWRRRQEGTSEMQEFVFDPERIGSIFSPSIHISSLCGYNYTPENYRYQAELLTSWGFECLRSRRGSDGYFWEIWCLSGLWSAKEELKEAIDQVKRPNTLQEMRAKLDAAVSFLCVHSSFGTLDVVIQRAAMTID